MELLTWPPWLLPCCRFVIGRVTNPINEKPSLQTLGDAFGALNAAYSAAAFIHAVLDKPEMASPQLPALVWSVFFAILSFIFYQNGMNTKAAIPLAVLAIVHGSWSVINPESVFSTYREGSGETPEGPKYHQQILGAFQLPSIHI